MDRRLLDGRAESGAAAPTKSDMITLIRDLIEYAMSSCCGSQLATSYLQGSPLQIRDPTAYLDKPNTTRLPSTLL